MCVYIYIYIYIHTYIYIYIYMHSISPVQSQKNVERHPCNNNTGSATGSTTRPQESVAQHRPAISRKCRATRPAARNSPRCDGMKQRNLRKRLQERSGRSVRIGGGGARRAPLPPPHGVPFGTKGVLYIPSETGLIRRGLPNVNHMGLRSSWKYS